MSDHSKDKTLSEIGARKSSPSLNYILSPYNRLVANGYSEEDRAEHT